MAFVEQINKRLKNSRTYIDSNKHIFHSIITPLHHEGTIDSGIFDTEIDMSPQRIDVPALDGWRVIQNGWHYALGIPEGKSTDGWVGFGGRQGEHWLQSRLVRVGYLHYPTRTWDDVGGSPTYDRVDLSQETQSIYIGPNNDEVKISSKAIWENIWTTPGGGKLDIQWRVSGDQLKEDIIVNQEARTWIATNHSPLTPVAETYFGFVFQIDPSDIPKWVKNGIVQNIDGDFDDSDGRIEIKDNLDRLLGFMPVSRVVVDGNRDFDNIKVLRKRIWKDPDGNYYLLVGIRVDELLTMADGDLRFDPDWSTAIGATINDGFEPVGVDWWTELDAGSGYGDYVGNSSTTLLHPGWSFQTADDLSNVASIDAAWFRTYAFYYNESTTITCSAPRVQDSTAVRWSSDNLPSSASWIDARAIGDKTFGAIEFFFGEGETYATDLSADILTLAPGSGEWINIALISTETSADYWVAFEDYSESGGHSAELYIEWTAQPSWPGYPNTTLFSSGRLGSRTTIIYDANLGGQNTIID